MKILITAMLLFALGSASSLEASSLEGGKAPSFASSTKASPKTPSRQDKADKPKSANALLEEKIKAYDKLSRVINVIEHYYVDKLTIDEIVNKAISGLMSNLDAHSSYLPPKQLKDLQMQTNGEFSGLGFVIGVKLGAITIVAPLDDSPAQKAGLKAGDIILKINDKSTLGLSLEDAVGMMRGKSGTYVTLTLFREGAKEPIIKRIKREVIKIRSVDAKEIANTDYLYIRVKTFDKNVANYVVDAFKEARVNNAHLKGVVLDLRNNPGGLLDQAIKLSNLFIDKGIIVSQKGRIKAEDMVYKANGRAKYKDIPMVILVNGGSASASEIVAGAMQDHRRAILVGEKTFGKGSVQVVLPLDMKKGALNMKEAIKLTTAKYYLPSGRTIQAVGIIPDIKVMAGKVPMSAHTAFDLKESDLKNHLQSELNKIDHEPVAKKKKGSYKVNGILSSKQLGIEDINKDIELKTAIDSLKTWNVIQGKLLDKENKGKKK